ncbi:MAG: hypothetical protein JWQ63_1326 [Mucilaginibacter sp.]|jgi:hypothetical protein|nr:hypothetical protein [Mucilaginibacter sp.]
MCYIKPVKNEKLHSGRSQNCRLPDINLEDIMIIKFKPKD